MYTIDTYNTIAECHLKLKKEYLKLESVRPIDILNNKDEVLTEAILSKDSINKIIDTLIAALEKTVKMFSDVTRKLKTKNAEWVQMAKQFDINSADLSNFEYQIFPYWEAIPSKFRAINIPDFNMEEKGLYENETQFMEKYFKNIIDEEGHVNKNIFRGLTNTNSEKVTVKGNSTKQVYNELVNLVAGVHSVRDDIARKVVTIKNTVARYRNSAVPTNESTLLSESIFKDEYFDILIEAATAVTTNDIEQEQKEKDKTINTSAEDNKAVKKDSDHKKSVVAWAKLCTSVTSAEMDILDEAYDEAVKFINKVMKAKKR